MLYYWKAQVVELIVLEEYFAVGAMFSSRSHNLHNIHFSFAQLFPDNLKFEHGSVSLLGCFLLTTSGKLVKHEFLNSAYFHESVKIQAMPTLCVWHDRIIVQ